MTVKRCNSLMMLYFLSKICNESNIPFLIKHFSLKCVEYLWKDFPDEISEQQYPNLGSLKH